MTCAYFAGVDIMDKCHLISISSYRQPFTYLSVNRMAQIAGRGRNGNLSETIIYDIDQKNNKSIEYDSNEAFRSKLVSKADKYVVLLNAIHKMAADDGDYKDIMDFIDSFVDYKGQIQVGNDYFVNIIRKNKDGEFVPAYLKIDALVERQMLYYEHYNQVDAIKTELEKDNNIQYEKVIIAEEDHPRDSVDKIKEENKVRKEAAIDQVSADLLEWIEGGKDGYQAQQFSQHQNKDAAKFANRFINLCPYMEPIILIEKLKEYHNNREFRNFNNALIFHALDDKHSFRVHVLAQFRYNPAAIKASEKLTPEQKNERMRVVFRSYFKRSVSDRVLANCFTVFFDATRSGGKDKIVGLNPLHLPEPLRRIKDGAELLTLFVLVE